MKTEEAIIKINSGLAVVLFICIPIAIVFFNPSNHSPVWPIGLAIIIFILYRLRVSYFYLDRVDIIKPYFFGKKTIPFQDINRINFTPGSAFGPSSFGIYYAKNGKPKKLALIYTAHNLTD
jgi:hypothetical protein